MLRNFILIAFRNLLTNKVSSFINIFSLAIGMASCLLILQFVVFELSYDKFHSKAENIYRIQYNGYQNGKITFECAAAVPAVGPSMKENLPEVINFTRLFPISGIVTYESPDRGLISFREEKMQITDPVVFKIFDFGLIKGDTATALAGPNKAVISENAAKKYFGEEDPINKMIRFDGGWEFMITGVFEDVPQNSHIKFDLLLSYETLNNATENESETAWGWYDFNTYVLVEENTNIDDLQKKWDKYLYDIRHEEWESRNGKQDFLFQPLLDIHLYSNLLQESEPQEQGDGNTVYFLSIIAFFILFIAWINYINLSTAKSVERANEVGLRKMMGALRTQLIRQFLIESIIINLIAALISILIFTLSMSFFNELIGKEVPLSLFESTWFWLALIILFVTGAIFAGIYPAFVLTAFKPAEVLKGKFNSSKRGLFMRRILVVFQFTASVFLITGTIIVYNQLRYMMNKDLGINISENLVLRGPGVTDSLYSEKLLSFKTEVLRNSDIRSLTAGTNVPGNEIYWTRGIKRLNGGPEGFVTVYNVGIDYDYLENFKLKVLEGRNFSNEFPSDNQALILNRSLFDILEFNSTEEAINEEVVLGGDTMRIIAIIEDYNQMSLKNNTAPIVFKYLPASSSFFAMKINSKKTQDILADVEKIWNLYFPGNPVEYFFLDEFFNKQYVKDQQFGKVFTLFSILAIIVACLGLFGLASYTITQRTKEIGIRKVLGSSVFRVVGLFIIDFIKPILISILISIPLSWIIMNNWLEGFPYRIGIHPFYFLISSIIVLFISIVTVGIQTLMAAYTNPAQSLRYE